ncbi:hypothetical protein H8S95_12970 [Pontibacter sp. KCTC 32443]|uniref:hypothetical protein n=1 Tax=Pontibacter TaxID=323449 RepID=UPI00164E1A6D|nr:MULTISPECIES: hypothetical protein [Pontibacter]MBC5774981.1 hypothetical protein [Pontibacter sp. KCTC 32443]
MTYKFYAFREDFEEIVRFIYGELGLSVFQSYSQPEKPLQEYGTAEQLLTELETGQNQIQLALWKKSFGFDYRINKIDLNPKYCNGHTFRYRIDGWGLIHFQISGLTGERLETCSISHNTEKRATTWESTNPDIGKVSEVNWEEVNKTSRKLKYLISKKLAKTRINEIDTLSQAKEYLELAKA